jgi:hypothetical protein
MKSVTDMSDSNTSIEEVFSIASQELLQGRSVEPVLEDYPDEAAQVREMLGVTAAMRAVSHPELSEEAMAKIRQRALATLQRQSATQANPSVIRANKDKARWHDLGAFFTRISPARLALFATVLLVLMISGVALSGVVAPQKPSKQHIVISYNGIITSMEPDRWMVDDTEILLDNATEIHGIPAVGAEMTCIGEALAEEQMHALEVWIHEGNKVPPGAPTMQPEGSSYSRH